MGGAHPYLALGEGGLSLCFPGGWKAPNDHPVRRLHHAPNHILDDRRVCSKLKVIFPDVLYEMLVPPEEAGPLLSRWVAHLEEKLRGIRGVIWL